MAHRLNRTSATCRPRFLRRRLAQSVSLGIISSALALPASAVEFNIGDIEGRFDSQLSIGSSWRVSDPSSDLISQANGGTSAGSGSYDDGTQNYAAGDAFSTVVKGVHDLELQKDNIGAFVRGKYWYDSAQSEGNANHGHSPNNYAANSELNDNDFNDYAKFSGAEILDAYIYGEFEVNDQPLDVRLGRQVVNWGESIFIQGGNNVINPIDVSAFRRAGAEIKEGLLPVNLAFASLGVTDNLSVEGFYQLEWEKTVIEGCGTYFSTNDFTAEGCDGIRIYSPTSQITANDATYFNSSISSFFDNQVVSRASDGIKEADDDGQFGIALRYYAEELNGTEFGLFYSRYHSRLPIISGIKTPNNPTTTALDPTLQAAVLGSLVTPQQAQQIHGLTQAFNSTYFVEYPEDINMIGLSFSTSIGDMAWTGEISHKRDVPVQLNGPMLVAAMLTLGTDTTNPASSRVSSAPFGGTISGYDEFNITQLQTGLIKNFDQVMGASRLTLVGELGWTHVHDLDEGDNAIKYGRNGIYGFSPSDDEGFVTQNSFGYIARATLNYPDVFAGVNLKPEVSLKHGLEGYGPQPGAVFNEDEKTLSMSLTADYLNQYQVQISYTNFFGGDFTPNKDRDFLSLSASVSF
ncbi:MAG: DUF1302 domain-containing protein [Amphritea sp.]|nr:DUF1302 domain-containing protein [Amphritea sp.]